MSFEANIPLEFQQFSPVLQASETPPSRRQSKLRLPSRGNMIGGLLAATAAIILLRSFVFTAGYEATLVANLAVVRAPFTGVLQETGAEVGDRVPHGKKVGTFSAQVGLAAAVSSGSQDLGQLRAQLAALDLQIASLETIAERIGQEARSYRSLKSAQAIAVSAEQEAALASALAEGGFADGQWERAKALAERGFISRAGLEKIRQEREAAHAQTLAAQARVQAADIERSAASKGLMVGNGYSDVQYSTQRLSDIRISLAQLRAERQITRASIEALESGPQSVDRQLTIPLSAVVSGRVWSKAAAPGETVQEGDAIYVLADCTNFFAYFAVGRSTYSSLTVGQKVTFIAASSNARWPGTIVNLGVNDPSQLRMTSGIDKPAGDRFLVGTRIKLPAVDQRACPVGTQGRVVLED